MIGLLCFVLAVLAAPFKSKIRLEAENAVLRHQLIVLRRKMQGRVRLTNNDRWFFINYSSRTARKTIRCSRPLHYRVDRLRVVHARRSKPPPGSAN